MSAVVAADPLVATAEVARYTIRDCSGCMTKDMPHREAHDAPDECVFCERSYLNAHESSINTIRMAVVEWCRQHEIHPDDLHAFVREGMEEADGACLPETWEIVRMRKSDLQAIVQHHYGRRK